MRELLTAAVRVGGVTHLVGPVTMVLQGGPRSEKMLSQTYDGVFYECACDEQKKYFYLHTCLFVYLFV